MPVIYRLLKWNLYALLILPLLVWGIFLFPFITTKVLYFRLLVEAALVLYLPLAIRYRELRPKFDLITKMVFAYFAVLIVSALFGVDVYRSFWGTIERGEGLITIAHYVAYFVILTAVFRTKEDWHRYLRAAVISTLLVALYAFAQILNLSFVMNAAGVRISGTVGNALFFAALMMFGMFLSLYLVGASRTGERFFLYGVFAFEFFLLYKSASRGAILATALAIFFYLVLKFFRSGGWRLKIATGALALLLLLGAGLVYFSRERAWVKQNSTLLRFASISTRDVTTQSRLDTWQASWKGWQERFFLGYGYENYNIAFNKYFPARIFKKPGSQIWFDRAHNTVFDVAVASGIFGLVAYLGIFAAASIVLIRQRGRSLILLFGLAAYFVQNLFVFDTHATHLMFYLVLAHIVFLGRVEQGTSAFARRRVWWLAVPVALFFLVFAYFVNVQPLLANYNAVAALKGLRGGDANAGLDYFRRALSYGTYMDAEIRQHFADAVLQTQAKTLYGLIAMEMRKNVLAAPRDVKNYLYLMNILNRLPNEASSYQEILSLAERAIRLSPTRPQIYSELGQAMFFRKEFSAGLENFRKAIELSPEPYISHFNYLLAGIMAGEAKIIAEETAIIERQYKHKFTGEEYAQIARAYQTAGDRDAALANYRTAIAIEPTRVEFRINLVSFFGEQCDLTAVRDEINEIIRLNRAYQNDAVAYLSQVEKNCKK